MRALVLVLVLAACRDFDPLEECSQGVCTVGPQCFTEVQTGWTHSCVLETNGSIWCWGQNNVVQLGTPFIIETMRATPELVPNLPPVSHFVAGDSFNCALSNGNVRCWGHNDVGQLGDGTMDDSKTIPSTVLGDLRSPTRVAGSISHACAIHAGGAVVCWGANTELELGDPDSPLEHRTPFPVSPLEHIVQVAVGFTHSCALDESGRVWCWGEGARGELGDGSNVEKVATPRQVDLQDLQEATAIAAGYHHTCAIKRVDGSVWCWGVNAHGQLGNQSTQNSAVPVRVRELTGVTSIALGGMESGDHPAHSCARTADGRVWCWGANRFGELGDSTTEPRAKPTPVTGMHDALDVSAGAMHSCAIRGDSTVWCWGANQFGQLGTGTYDDSHVPVKADVACP